MSANPFLFTEEDYLPQPASNPFLTDFNDEQPTTTPNTNPFAFDPDELESTQQTVHNFFDVHQSEPPAQKPTELDLKFTNTVDEVPARPPPSKETQDLFMSVMGAMDATSSHLLDRIPPTRTPSPVSVRDLHSPSPTPDAPFGDLLDVGDVRAPTVEKKQDDDLLMMGEVEVVEKAKPARPGPPVRPPKPPPPKPPPPVLSAPPKPPPPVNNHKVDDGMLDLFGVESVVKPQKTTVSKDDILNLYKAPPKPEPVKDLLFDDALETVETVPAEEPKPPIEVFEPVQPPPKPKPPQPEILKTIAQPPPQPPTPFPEEAAPFPTSSPEIQEDKLVQTPVNGNLYVDTSGSQSKGSISSMTQNPFAIDDSSQQPSLLPSPGVQSEPIVVAEKEPDVLTSYPSEPVVKEGFDDFDAFAQKFESAVKDENKNGFDAFLGTAGDTWGGDSGFNDSSSGFDNEDGFDSFLAMKEPPNKMNKAESQDSDEDKDFSVIIRPTGQQSTPFGDASVPVLAPPPVVAQSAFTDTSPRLNPFDQSDLPAATAVSAQEVAAFPGPQEFQRTDSQETPPTPLFDDDVSQPLEPFPRTICEKKEWEMQLRQPNKKKITGQRFWKKIHVKLLYQADCVLLQLYNQAGDKDPFQELPLQPCYSVSDIGTQQYDQYGKIFTVKLQYIFYKERPGVRPGQVKKAEKITNKLSQFAAYAIQGDYQGVKEFGSDLKKLGLPVEHAPQVSQLMKLGSLNYEDLKQFSVAFEEALFTLQAHRDRALHYKMEEVQVTAVDELYVEQNAEGHVEKQIARVRLFFLGFLTGMPDIELGVNDMRRQGKEVVGRHDIIPVVTEEWIRLENVEFHNCVDQEEYNKTHIIKFKPPDACYIELLRFRIRPPKNRELPLQLKATICVTGTKIELRADVLVPGFASRKLGQVPCEDVMIRFPIPECWIYMFRVEKHFRYGSVKSAHRRTGKIKGIERILGTVDALQESLIEVTSGQAKYEHQHRAIVWRCPRLPKEGQGAYTTHNMVCRLALTSFDQMPEQLAEYCYVEFTMPATQASHTTVRSVSLQNSDSDEPPEKYVRYLARHEYRVGIEHTQGEGPNAYVVATMVKPAPVPEEPAAIPEAESSSDSD